jgi:hypothetical protein
MISQKEYRLVNHGFFSLFQGQKLQVKEKVLWFHVWNTIDVGLPFEYTLDTMHVKAKIRKYEFKEEVRKKNRNPIARKVELE